MTTNLEIDSIWEYYDAPICGAAHIGELRLYYFWLDDVMVERDGRTYKLRQYTAYALDDETWAFLERDRALTDAANPEAPVTRAEENRWTKVGEIHKRLLETDGVVSFTSASVPFPCYV